MSESNYVSNVDVDQITLVTDGEEEIVDSQNESANLDEEGTDDTKFDNTKTLTAQTKNPGILTKIGIGAGRVVSTFNQAAKDAFKQLLIRLFRSWPLWH